MAGKGQLKCVKCGGSDVKKCGFFKNRNGVVQRHACLECGKTFSQSNNNGMRIGKDKIMLAIKLLCESSGIRATSRIVGIHQETVLKILKISGTIAENLMEEKAKNLKCNVVCVDEVYSFVGIRENHLKNKVPHLGAQFTFFSVDVKSRFIINTFTGERDCTNAATFLGKLKARVPARFQLNSDAWPGYRGVRGNCISRVFGTEIDHATEEKTFWKLGQFVSRRLAKITRRARIGNPDLAKASTSRVERTNLNLRTFSRRFTRCTLGFSKKLINHRLAVNLFVWHQNFARKHGSLKSTPAIDIGIAVAIMTIVELWDIGV